MGAVLHILLTAKSVPWAPSDKVCLSAVRLLQTLMIVPLWENHSGTWTGRSWQTAAG